MEQSCSKPRMRPIPQDIHYSSYPINASSSSSSTNSSIFHPPHQLSRLMRPNRHHVESGMFYRRNDPANRAYRMKKRVPAQVYHCVQCNKNIKYPSKITEHIRKHTGEKPHTCGICLQSFSQAHTLKTHMQQHSHEKPYKCAFCPEAFVNIHEKRVHEDDHMHPETIGVHSVLPPFIQVQETTPIDEDTPLFECPEICGFRSYDEAEVIEHIAIGHQDNPYEDVCWDEEDSERNRETVVRREVVERSVRRDPESKIGMNVIPIQNRQIIVREFAQEPEQIYEYFQEQFVPQVSTKALIGPETTTEEVVVSTSYHQNHHHFDEQNAGPSGESIASEQIIYNEETVVAGEEEEGEVISPTDKIIKREVIQEEHIYENMIIHQDIEGIVEENELEDDDEEQERVRVIGNPNPPKRGTKSLRDHHEASAAMTEMILDASTLEMAQPSRHMKQGFPTIGRKTRGKRAENLDWIIDAVAKGVDVSVASPHVRKKPTLHKCEFCGRVDKYPSKIQAHMRTHTGEKPFKCEICGMTFSQKTPMRLHLRRHLDQKPYVCDFDGCKEGFVSGAILKLHVENKHLNKKRYVCRRGCGRVFSSSFNQKHHEKKCSQNTHLTWVEEENGETGDEESNGEYPEDDEEYMDQMMDPTISVSNHQIVEHFVEEPVFLHQ
uniref:Zinc finger protein n=2 Tax=Caenorhabditis tropicalis TaxID=1561998 RepID=A0A1I7UM28_9PELO